MTPHQKDTITLQRAVLVEYMKLKKVGSIVWQNQVQKTLTSIEKDPPTPFIGIQNNIRPPYLFQPPELFETSEYPFDGTQFESCQL